MDMIEKPGVSVAPSTPNQAPPLENYNVYQADHALRAAVARHSAAWAHEALARLGATAGSPHAIELGFLANRNPPTLHTHDRFGDRRDAVEFHPAYHELMALACAEGLHTSPWAQPRAGAQVARAAGYIVYGQIESGTQCPVTMTFAATPLLRSHADTLPAIRDTWLPRLYARSYDARFAPIEDKRGATIGMGMTERQGGSDVRTNTTRAEPIGARGAGQRYRITGQKWFMSAPMCDAFMVLAQAPGGLSCFFLPRFVDGAVNAIRLLRLKDKVGNRSNASAEPDFDGAQAYLIGDEGRGVSTILEMVGLTRLDCVLGSAAQMRQALAQAMHHARHRVTFGRPLAEHALMRKVLADLALESEAATALALWLAHLYDGHDARAVALRRLLTPAAKYWICKRAAGFCQEAMEVLGGNGYVEDSILSRLYREAPVNSIWEGSGNIMCLDVLRALRREPDAIGALAAELAPVRGADNRLDAAITELTGALTADGPFESAARRLAERLVLVMQAALLVRDAPPPVADAFCASRLARDCGSGYGTLPERMDLDAIIERAWPR